MLNPQHHVTQNNISGYIYCKQSRPSQGVLQGRATVEGNKRGDIYVYTHQMYERS
jgi:hypothetical protein